MQVFAKMFDRAKYLGDCTRMRVQIKKHQWWSNLFCNMWALGCTQSYSSSEVILSMSNRSTIYPRISILSVILPIKLICRSLVAADPTNFLASASPVVVMINNRKMANCKNMAKNMYGEWFNYSKLLAYSGKLLTTAAAFVKVIVYKSCGELSILVH